MTDDPKTQTIDRCRRTSACAAIAGLVIIVAITPLAATTPMPEWLRSIAVTIGALLVIIGVIYGATSLIIRSQPQLVYIHPDVDGLRSRVGATEDALTAVIRSLQQPPKPAQHPRQHHPQPQRTLKKSIPAEKSGDALTMAEYAEAIELGKQLERQRTRPESH